MGGYNKVKETLIYYLFRSIPDLVMVVAMLLMIFISYTIGSGQANKMWKINLKYHLPEVARDEIKELEQSVKELEQENIYLKTKLDALLPVVKAVRDIDFYK